jgi:hypothetical protein
VAVSRVTLQYPVLPTKLPDGLIILHLELKYCEACGSSFSREFSPTEVRGHDTVYVYGLGDKEVELRKDRGDRFCGRCKSRQLLPDLRADELYRAQFPGSERQMKTRYQGPKYDESLVKKAVVACYRELKVMTAVAEKMGISYSSVRRYCRGFDPNKVAIQ